MVLHEKEDPESILQDGERLAAVMLEAADATAIHCNPSSALNWRPRSLGSGVFISWSGKRNFAG